MKKYFKANFTVETALIMPIIMSVIILGIYLMLLLYDKTVLYVAAYHGAVAYTYESGISNSKLEKLVARAVYERTDNRLVGTDDISLAVKVTKNKVKVDITAQTMFDDAVFIDMSMLGMDKLSVTYETNRQREAQLLLNTHRVRKGYEILKDYIPNNDKAEDEGEN